VQCSPRRPVWNVNRTSEPDLFAKQWAPRMGSVVRVHGIPPFSRRVRRLPEPWPTRVARSFRLRAASH